MTTPTERKLLELIQDSMSLLDVVFEMSAVDNSLLLMGYDGELNRTTIVTMRYAPGRVEPSDLEPTLEMKDITHLENKPTLSLVPKE